MSPMQMLTVPETTRTARDFSLRVETPACEPRFAGIFSVALGDAIPVTFVPGFRRPPASWENALVDDLDDIGTSNAARLASALLAGYVVTSDDSRAGQIEIVRVPDGELVHRTAIYYVTTEEFEIFAFEIAHASQLPRHTLTAVSSRYRFARFLRHDVVGSRAFLAEDRRRLSG